MTNAEKIKMVKNFLEGKENILFDAKASIILSKLHYSKDMFGFYLSRAYKNHHEVFEKYDSNIIFFFFPEKKTILFTPNPETYYLEQLFGGYEVCQNSADVAKFLGYKFFYQNEIAKKVETKFESELLASLLKKYPNFETFPEDVQSSVIEARKTYLKDYYGTDGSYSSNEKERVLRGEKSSFSIGIPEVDSFKLATAVILGGEEKAVELLKTEDKEDDKQKRMKALASYYLHIKGMKEAEDNLSENDKKKRTYYNAIQKVEGEKLTVIYDAKKVLSGLTEIREKVEDKNSSMGYSRRDTWNSIFKYLDAHDELTFKADKDRGFSVAEEFIVPWHTDMANKPVFGLDRYEHIPTEMEKVLDNLDNLIDIRYRNKSIIK